MKVLLSMLLLVAGVHSSAARLGYISPDTMAGRRLLQDAANNLIPLYQDQSPCAIVNALEASPVFNQENVDVGYVLLRQSSANISGAIHMEMALTAHVGEMFIAAVNATDGKDYNLWARLTTELPDACPSATTPLYETKVTADCSRRRAVLDMPIPIDIFNCSYLTPADFEVIFYLQLAAELSTESCSPPTGTYYAGSKANVLPSGCSYITVKAVCTPATCSMPYTAPSPTNDQLSKNMIGVAVGVSVGTAVLIAGILAGVLYLRKREREQEERRQLRGKGDGSDMSSSSDEEYELDFSRKSSGAMDGILSSPAIARASALFSRTHQSVIAAKMAGGATSVTGAGPGILVEPTHGSCVTVTGAWQQRPGEELRQQGVPRFSDKYLDQSPTSPSGVYSPLPQGPAFGSHTSFSVPMSGISSTTPAQGPAAAGDDPARYGLTFIRGSVVRPSPSSTITRLPLVPITPGGRSSALLLAELGYGAGSQISLRRAGGGANLTDPDLVPENSCSFINPLAVMLDGGGGGGAPPAIRSPSSRLQGSAATPQQFTSSHYRGRVQSELSPPSSPWSSVPRRSAGQTHLRTAASYTPMPTPPTPPTAAVQPESGEDDELVTSDRRRRPGSTSAGRGPGFDEPSFKTLQLPSEGDTGPEPSGSSGAGVVGRKSPSRLGVVLEISEETAADSAQLHA